MATTDNTGGSLPDDRLAEFEERGFVHLEGVFDPAETEQLADEVDRLVDEWAEEDMGWGGDWREEYLDPDTREATSLVHLHDLQFYSAAWTNAVTDDRLVGPVTDMLGPDVELHHTTLHAKPPDRGSPFPMHQDWAFYKHEGPSYVDAIVHLDDVPTEKGPLQFIPGSHRDGALDHIEGEGQAPHLPTGEYGLEDAVEVEAEAGDVVVFNYHTIHGSDLNQTDEMRRLVRVGYRDPANPQYEGQSLDREGLMVAGEKRR
jgi:hypothetical protein